MAAGAECHDAVMSRDRNGGFSSPPIRPRDLDRKTRTAREVVGTSRAMSRCLETGAIGVSPRSEDAVDGGEA